MYSIEIQNKYSLDQNQIKAFKERISYLNSHIISCKFNNNIIKLVFDKNITVKEKNSLIKSCERLISRVQLIKSISDEKIIYENNVRVENKKNIFNNLLRNIFAKRKIQYYEMRNLGKYVLDKKN